MGWGGSWIQEFVPEPFQWKTPWNNDEFKNVTVKPNSTVLDTKFHKRSSSL